MQVTVVIPSYNHAQYVLQAIDSVLAQSWPEVDLIVIDDGSTDGSAERIREHHAQTGGYRYIHRENRGLIRTLNEGLQLARGEFFCELASDDYFPVDSIEKRAVFLRAHQEYVAVFANGWMLADHELTHEMLVNEKRKAMFSLADPIPTMLEGVLPIFSTGLIRKEALQQIGGFDAHCFRYYEDLEPPLLLAVLGKIGYLDEPVICRRQHATNVSSTTPHVRFEKINLYKKLLANSDLVQYQTLIRKKLLRSYLGLARLMPELSEPLAQKGREVLGDAWPFVISEPRLLWYLLRHRVCVRKA